MWLMLVLLETSVLDQRQPQSHLQGSDEPGQAILLCDYLQKRKIWCPTNNFLCGAFDHGWYEFQLIYWNLCSSFCKSQMPDPASRDPWSHQQEFLIKSSLI